MYIYIYISREREREREIERGVLVHGVVVGLLHLAHLRRGLHVAGPHGDVLVVIGDLLWRDAVRGARWGLEYLDLLRDIWASELTSP